jgi:uncharacterized phage infection (PIP) family protein YhgE
MLSLHYQPVTKGYFSMAQTTSNSVELLNKAIDLTNQTSGNFSTIGNKVEMSMAGLAGQFKGKQANDFQQAMIEWQDQLNKGVQAFNEMAQSLADGIGKFNAQTDRGEHRVSTLRNQIGNGGKDFGAALGVG